MGSQPHPLPDWSAEQSPGERRLERDPPIAQRFNLVAPMGHPMNHAAHVGFSGPPTRLVKVGWPLPYFPCTLPHDLVSVVSFTR